MLFQLLLLIVGFSFFSVFLMKGTIWYSGRVISRRVDRSHREAQHLIEVKSFPPSWGKLLEIESYGQYQRGVNKRFKSLIGYFSHSPVFEDEESRELLLSQLRTLWKEMARQEYFKEKVLNVATK